MTFDEESDKDEDEKVVIQSKLKTPEKRKKPDGEEEEEEEEKKKIPFKKIKIEFKWKESIRKTVKTSEGKSIKVKALRKHVLSLYKNSLEESGEEIKKNSKEELKTLFESKLSKVDNLVIHGKIVKYVK